MKMFANFQKILNLKAPLIFLMWKLRLAYAAFAWQKSPTRLQPNWTKLPYSNMPVPGLRDARPACWVTFYSICTNRMPRAQNRFNSIVKTINIAYLGIIYLCNTHSMQQVKLYNHYHLEDHLPLSPDTEDGDFFLHQQLRCVT